MACPAAICQAPRRTAGGMAAGFGIDKGEKVDEGLQAVDMVNSLAGSPKRSGTLRE
jgi:hypothetical protein